MYIYAPTFEKSYCGVAIDYDNSMNLNLEFRVYQQYAFQPC